MKPNLSADEIARVKKVAENLLAELKHNKLQVHHWREKELTRDAVHTAIYNFLYDEAKGLPESYQLIEIQEKTDLVYAHVFDCYPYLPSPYYGADLGVEDAATEVPLLPQPDGSAVLMMQPLSFALIELH